MARWALRTSAWNMFLSPVRCGAVILVPHRSSGELKLIHTLYLFIGRSQALFNARSRNAVSGTMMIAPVLMLNFQRFHGCFINTLVITASQMLLLTFRVNGVLSNMEEFAKVYNCPKGSSLNPEQRCRLWWNWMSFMGHIKFGLHSHVKYDW